MALRIAEPAKETGKVQGCPILTLPDELLLIIADFLDQVFQVLFGLSCKRLRFLLASRFDLSVSDRDAKLRLPKILELDFPEHMVCQPCGFMFKW